MKSGESSIRIFFYLFPNLNKKIHKVELLLMVLSLAIVLGLLLDQD